MLVLSRKIGQRIVINNDIWIEVVETWRNGKCRLGITAPPNIRIDREEVHRNRQANSEGNLPVPTEFTDTITNRRLRRPIIQIMSPDEYADPDSGPPDVSVP